MSPNYSNFPFLIGYNSSTSVFILRRTSTSEMLLCVYTFYQLGSMCNWNYIAGLMQKVTKSVLLFFDFYGFTRQNISSPVLFCFLSDPCLHSSFMIIRRYLYILNLYILLVYFYHLCI